MAMRDFKTGIILSLHLCKTFMFEKNLLICFKVNDTMKSQNTKFATVIIISGNTHLR